ncbi:MAG: radical SAM protein [Nitrospirota bacterium]
MKVREKIGHILDRARDRQRISQEEATVLMGIDERSHEMYALMSTANRMTREQFSDTAEIFAQVGINNGPCPKNCKFCFFGEAWGQIREPLELSAEQVVFRVKEFEKAGANAVLLMTTANYPFDKYIEIGREVRKALGPGMPLCANIGDIGPAEVRRLEEAGFTSANHTFRLREGTDTCIDVTTRKKTLEAIRDSGLALTSCLEPIGPEHSNEEILDLMFFAVRECRPTLFSTMNRVPVPGTPFGDRGTISKMKLAKVTAVARIVCCDDIENFSVHPPSSVTLASGANSVAAEVGANPRDTAEETSKGIGLSVEVCKRILQDADYKILKGFSKAFAKPNKP